MKQELQNKLVEILTSIQTATGKAADFAIAELPDIAQQYLTFSRMYESFLMIVLLGSFLIMAVFTAKIYKSDDRELTPIPFGFSCGLFIFSLAQIRDTLLVWVAPKVWLITELAKLIK